MPLYPGGVVVMSGSVKVRQHMSLVKKLLHNKGSDMLMTISERIAIHCPVGC